MGHAILQAPLSAIAAYFMLPEQYKLISAHYHEHNRLVNFVVESAEIPEEKDNESLPTLKVYHSVEFHPDDHSFKKITGIAKII
jgi:hypothetical protein